MSLRKFERMPVLALGDNELSLPIFPPVSSNLLFNLLPLLLMHLFSLLIDVRRLLRGWETDIPISRRRTSSRPMMSVS